MMKLTAKKTVLLLCNLLLVVAVCLLNYCYMSQGYAFFFKCTASIGFALMGLLNLGCALLTRHPNRPFFFLAAGGMLLALLGDCLINGNFLAGAGAFAAGHLSFLAAFCCLGRFRWADLLFSLLFALGGGGFLLLDPALDFPSPVIRWGCVVYCGIISVMVGKGLGNLLARKSPATLLLAAGGVLFYFSDLMLVFDGFAHMDWASEACIATYYPALCLLGMGIFFAVIDRRVAPRR
ncbi:MAG: hypothetical protein E7486_05845 [Ruminococcaceae bacterium]|nr:hypothetical protein [Oscillospiraceae bacterium]